MLDDAWQNRDLFQPNDAPCLLSVVQKLSHPLELNGLMEVVRTAARDLTGADGITFVLREGDFVHYADESAICRLWKGQRFPATACISGWAMIHKKVVVIDDVFADPRIPHSLYRPTFVRSLAMVPVRVEEPVAAIGAYWAGAHRATPRELAILETLAGTTALAMENVRLSSELQQAMHVREELMGIAAHELKTPLTPLKVQVQALSRRLEQSDADSKAMTRGFQRVDAQLKRLERLVDHLLDHTRLSRCKILLDCEELDLAELAREAVERFEETARQAGATLRLDAPRPVIGIWDRLRIERVFDNLLSNAIKYSEGRPVEIEVGVEDAFARVTVCDHGMGISPELQPHLFNPFERATSDRHFGGFGIGLWVVRQTIEAHHGQIEAESRPGEGSTFRFFLPPCP